MSTYDHEARRRGKKVRVHESRAIPGQTVKVDVRLDFGTGVFSAFYGSEWHEASEYKAVTQLVDAAIKKSLEVTWAYYIEVDNVEFAATDETYTRHPERAYKLILTYRLLRLSNEMQGTAGRHRGNGPYRLRYGAAVKDDGQPDYHTSERPDFHVIHHDDPVLIPFTLERWLALAKIGSAVEVVGRRLKGFLSENAEATAKFLDEVEPEALMLAPIPVEAREAPKRKRR